MAARPQSRGLGAPGGGAPLGPPGGGMGGMGAGPVQATLRPGTMMGGGGRMPTAQGGRMATRQGTRQGTASQGPGVGLLTEVKVSDRPITGMGVMGMKTGAVGPKRQIYDKTYYRVELGKKCQDLQDEVARLNKEINEIQQANQLFQSLDKRYESLVKTVRSLEGDLADYNLATDKQRTDTRPEEVHHMYMHMKSQNEQQRSDVDQIFMEKRGHEEEIGRMEQEMQQIARAAEERLNELHPDQRREYEDLRDENGRLGADLQEAREELDNVNGRLNAVEGRLRSDLLRTRYQQLISVRKELTERLEHLEQEVQQCSLSIPQQRDLLLGKVKTDNAEIVAAEKSNEQLKMAIEKLRSAIRDVNSDAQEKKEEGGDQQKYEILFAKDTEMTQFIDGFAESKAAEEKQLEAKQASITQLLENISKACTLSPDVSPESHLKDMEDELDFKNKALINSETTQNRLESELAKREGELEKIHSLDVKISLELQQVEVKMRQYEDEIENKYSLVAEMRAQGEEQMRQLEARKKALEARAVAVKQQVNFQKLKCDSKKQQLADNEVATSLEAQEQKIRQFGQTLQTLRSFINQKTSETDYGREMAACLDMAAQINKILVDPRLQPGGQAIRA